MSPSPDISPLARPVTRPAMQPATQPILWADSNREAAFTQWLGSLATPQALIPASLRLASADASFRRYLSVDSSDPQVGRRIIMDAQIGRASCRERVCLAV